MVGDPSGSAVERFLRWEDDPQRRDVALTIALARWFNRDLLAAVLDPEMAGQLWDWIRTRPFVIDHPAGHQYHQAVRAHMLRLHRRESPDTWRQRHQALAAYHNACQDALGLGEQTGWKDPVWQKHALEETYHRLCAAPQVHLSDALDQVLRAYQVQTTLARRWIEVLQQAGADNDASNVQKWGQRLHATLSGSDDDWLALLTLLIQDAGLAPQRQAAAFGSRARLHRRVGAYEPAIADFDRAIELRPDHGKMWAGRGETYRAMGRYDEALADYNRAIDLDPDYAWAVADRGQTYRAMGRYDEALADFERVLEIDPGNVLAITIRGQLLRRHGGHERELAVLAEQSDLTGWALTRRAELRLLKGQYEAADADIERAIMMDPKTDWFHYVRALVKIGQGQDVAARNLIARATLVLDTGQASTVNEASALFNRAAYLAALGDDEGSRSAIESLRTLSSAAGFSDTVPIERVVEIMELHQYLIGRPMVDQALEALSKLLALHPDLHRKSSVEDV